MDAKQIKAELEKEQKEIDRLLKVIDKKENWNISPEQRAQLEVRKEKIRFLINDEVSYRKELKALQSELEKARKRYKSASKDKDKENAKRDIERLDFAINKLNGVVDPKILAKDKYMLQQANAYYKAMKEQELIQDLSNELLSLYNKKDEIRQGRNKLRNLNPNSSEYKTLAQRISDLDNEIKLMGKGVKDIAGDLKRRNVNVELKLNFDDPRSFSLNDVYKSLEHVDTLIKPEYLDKERNKAFAGKYRALRRELIAKYGIIENAKIIGKPFFDEMDARVSEIRSDFKAYRVKNLEKSVSGKDTQAKESNSNRLIPKELPNYSGETSLQLYTKQKKKSIHTRGTNAKVEQVFNMPTNVNDAIESNPDYPIKIEDGRFYRFVPINGQLQYVSQDINVYMKNTKKQLKRELKDLKEKMTEAVGGKKELKRLCKELRKTEGKDNIFANYVGSSGLFGWINKTSASDKIMSGIENDGPIVQLQMLLALKAAITPEQVNDVFKNLSNPLPKNYPSDLMDRIVVAKDGLLSYGKLKYREKASLFELPGNQKVKEEDVVSRSIEPVIEEDWFYPSGENVKREKLTDKIKPPQQPQKETKKKQTKEQAKNEQTNKKTQETEIHEQTTTNIKRMRRKDNTRKPEVKLEKPIITEEQKQSTPKRMTRVQRQRQQEIEKLQARIEELKREEEKPKSKMKTLRDEYKEKIKLKPEVELKPPEKPQQYNVKRMRRRQQTPEKLVPPVPPKPPVPPVPPQSLDSQSLQERRRRAERYNQVLNEQLNKEADKQEQPSRYRRRTKVDYDER